MKRFKDFIVTESDNDTIYDLVAKELGKYVATPMMIYKDKISLGYEYDNEDIELNIYLKEKKDKIEITVDKIKVEISDSSAKNTWYSLNVDTYEANRRTVPNDISVIAKEIRDMIHDDFYWIIDELTKFSKEINASINHIKSNIIIK